VYYSLIAMLVFCIDDYGIFIKNRYSHTVYQYRYQYCVLIPSVSVLSTDTGRTQQYCLLGSMLGIISNPRFDLLLLLL